LAHLPSTTKGTASDLSRDWSAESHIRQTSRPLTFERHANRFEMFDRPDSDQLMHCGRNVTDHTFVRKQQDLLGAVIASLNALRILLSRHRANRGWETDAMLDGQSYAL
jgi:hypothetical protein